jgi:hypothetical protein
MISQEFKNEVIKILEDCICQIDASNDEEEDLTLIGLMAYISNELRKLSFSRNPDTDNFYPLNKKDYSNCR